MNGDALAAVFDLVFAQLQQVAQEGTVMDCADGTICHCVPLLSAWMADHVEHLTLHGICRRSCPRFQVSCKELGENPQKKYVVSDYICYREKPLEHQPREGATSV